VYVVIDNSTNMKTSKILSLLQTVLIAECCTKRNRPLVFVYDCYLTKSFRREGHSSFVMDRSLWTILIFAC